MHNLPTASALRVSKSSAFPTTVRRAVRGDAAQILELVSPYAAQGLMLPRTLDEIASRIDS